MTAARDPGSRLERALEVFFAAPPTTPGDAERLLARHPDLRDLLEPMLEGEGARDEADDERVLGDFRLVRELGRGGMGIVHEAWQRSLDRRVAVKVLAPALVASPAAVARFRREAAAAGRLRHPNIVEVFGFGSDQGQHFFAMQLVDGESLHTCKVRFREPRHAIDLVVQLVDALVHAHAQGLVHRDVKPANVIVRDDRSPMLTDFGIASDEALPSLTREGGFLGTLDYASPEQVRGEVVDARTDVWAVGVVLHELLTGRHPFAAATQEATLHNILSAEPPSLQKERAVSSDLAAVVLRALEKNRTRRYASAAALLTDLRALQQGAAVSARLPTASERMLRWARREPWRAVATVILLIAVPVLTGTLGYLWANAPRIEAATAAEAARTREEVLAEAWWMAHESDAKTALAILDGMPATDEEVAISRALLLQQQKLTEQARTVLAPFTGPSVELVRRSLLQPLVLTELVGGKRDDAFDCFVRAQLMFEVALFHDAQVRSVLRHAVEMAKMAVALAPSPRISYLITLVDAADLAGDRPVALTAERALARHFPDSPVAQRRRANVLAKAEPEQALALLTDPAPHAGSMASYWRIRAAAYETLRQFAEAIEANEKAIASDPGQALSWGNMGIVLRKQKVFDKSVEALQRAVALKPQSSFWWNALGLSLRAGGDTAAATAAFKHALEVHSDYAPAAYNLGNLLMSASDFAGAVVAFEQAVANDPEDVRSVSNLGDALKRAGRKQESFVLFVRATQLAPNDLIPQFNLARTALDLGLLELALPAARRANELDPKGPNGAWILADVLLAQPTVDAPAALAHARLADQRSKGSELAIRIALARALEQNGERAAAIAMLEAAEREPKFSNSSERDSLAEHLTRMRAAQ